MTGIYAVLDLVANEIKGGLHLHKADAAAVRMFTDALVDPNTILAQHPQDFNLLHMADLTEDNSVTPIDMFGGPRVVLTGKAWKEMQDSAAPQPQTGSRPDLVRALQTKAVTNHA